MSTSRALNSKPDNDISMAESLIYLLILIRNPHYFLRCKYYILSPDKNRQEVTIIMNQSGGK